MNKSGTALVGPTLSAGSFQLVVQRSFPLLLSRRTRYDARNENVEIQTDPF